MRRSWNYFCRRFSCTRSALTSRAIADAIFFAVLLSAIAVALGPSISIQSPLNITYSYSAINLNYTYDTATSCKYELTNTTGAFNTSLPACQNTTLSGITEGANSVKVWANDSANNWNVSNAAYFSVDTIKPEVRFVAPTDNTTTITRPWSYVNVTVNDSSGTTAFIDWNNSLVGWWRFNGETGETSSFFTDWSTYRNNATCTNCPVPTPGRFGSALQFDGVNDYLSIPDTDSLDLGSSFTIEGWFKPSRTFDGSADYYQGILDKGAYQLFLDKSDGKLKFSAVSGGQMNWSPLGSGMNEEVESLVVWNGSLYAGGWFTSAGGLSANRTARWNGSEWSSLGSGMDGIVYSLVVWNGSLYAGGAFTSAGGLSANFTARWNGSEWSSLGSGMDWTVYSLAVWNGSLYASGIFASAGGVSVNRTARWNGSGWSSLGSGMDGGVVYSLAVWNGSLYAGGGFTSAGGVSANLTARWNGSGWSSLGSGMDWIVYSLAVWNGSLYAGGDFASAGGVSANRIAKWNGTDWRPLGSGMGSRVRSLAVWNGDLYAGGYFTSAGGVSANSIAGWNGTGWSALGSGMSSWVDSFAVWDGELYVGGWFYYAGGNPVAYIAKWSSGEERIVGSSTNSWLVDWQHFAVTYDNTSLKLYRNGVLEGSVSANISVAANSLPLLLGTSYGSREGRYTSSGAEQFEGAIDEIRIHRRALSDEEINASFNSGAYRLYRNFTNLSDGVYNFSAYAQDSAGNINQTETRILTLDTSPPAWVQVPANQTTAYNASFAYDINATDLSGVDRYWIDDNANFTINPSSGLVTNNTFLGIGSYPLNVSVNDTRGYVNSILFTVNVRDTSMPALTVSSPQFANYTTANPNLSITTSENATITYDWDGTGNISGCRNCTSYNSTYGELVPDADTLLLLHFNENYGNISHDQTGANNGTIYGANWGAGRFGYGLAFDGTNRNVTLPAGLDPVGAFTVEAWVNATGTSSQMAIADKSEEVGAYANGYSLYLKNGAPWFGVYNSNNMWVAEWRIDSDIRNTGWHYVAGVYNGTSMRIFLDNRSEQLSGTYIGGASGSSVNLTIGNRANKTWYLNGTLDEVRITSRALSDPELAAGRNRGLSDGTHTITVYATDSDGNANYTAVSFNTDATLPFCTSLSANRTYFRNGTPLGFTAFCNDTSTSVSSVYLNASAIGRAIVQMTPSGGGYYTYTTTVNSNSSGNLTASIYNVTDAYGNINLSNPAVSLTIDNTDPVAWLNLSLNQSWQRGQINLAYIMLDTQSIDACLFGYPANNEQNFTYDRGSCGTTTFGVSGYFCADSATPSCVFRILANDSAGNSNSSELYFRIDNSPPNISQILPVNNSVLYSNITRISFNITDPFSGVNLSTLEINDSTSVYNTTNISCSQMPNGYNCSLSIAQTDGLKSLRISAYDNLSNLVQTTRYYTVAGCQPPPAGDWAIDYTQSCANRTIVLNGNLTVYSNGNLTFRNATLLMNGTYDGSRGIGVQGGAFYILDNDGVQSTPDGSNISALDSSSRFLFMIGANSTFEMRNSELSYGGYAGGGIISIWYDPGGSFNVGEGAVILAANARLTGSKISNSFNGIAGILENATFENNTITSNSGDGMRLLANNSVFRGNRLAANGQYGIFLLGSHHNFLSNNNISSNGGGIRLRYSANNTIFNNTLSSNSGRGILLEENSKNNSLRLNSIIYNSGSGAYFQESGYNDLANNTISSNADGVTLYSSTGERITGNALSGNNPYSIHLLYSNSSTISNNTISASTWDGLRLQYAHANNFSGNTVSGSGEAGVYLIGSANNFFSRGDNFYGDLYGLYFNGASENIFASSTVSSGSGVLRYDLYSVGNSTNTLLNSSYSSPKTYFENGSNILRQWYLHLTAVNASLSPLNNASITVIDNRSSVAFSGVTGSDGAVLIPLTESIVSTGMTAYTPHRIIANTSGFFGNASMTMNESKNLTLALYDVTPPQLLDYWFEPQYVQPGSTTVFRAYLWENSRVSSAWFRLATPNGTYNFALAFQSENSTGQTWFVQITNTSWMGQYNLTYLFLNDTNGNNDTPAISAYFRAQSDLPPNITYSETNAQNVEVNSSITISANVSDDHNVTATYLSVLSPAISQGSMLPVSGNRTFGLWRINYTPAQTGTYYYRITANDNSSNTGYSAQYSFNSTPYNCTSASRISTYESCMAVGCLWSVGAFPLCSFYNSSTDRNTFELALNSDATFIALTNKDRIGRLTSTTGRNAVINISINGIMVSLPLPIAANSPREVGVLTYGLALSPSNSSILTTAYSNYRFSSTINGSGNVSAIVYTSTLGAPENITLDNVPLPFSYNNASKIAELNMSLGSPHNLEIKFTQPCAPLGGSCGTCCAGLSCCTGICSSSCTPAQQTQQSTPAGPSLPVKSVSITASVTTIETKVGVPASFTVTVKNTGTDNLTAVVLDVANITRGWFKIMPLSNNLQVGTEATYAITVTPPLDGTYPFSIYVPTPRSQNIQITLMVRNDYATNPGPEPITAAAVTQEEAANMQELELLLKGIEENLTVAKKQGVDVSSLEKTLEEARLAVAEGKQEKAALLLDYLKTALPKIKTEQAGTPSGPPLIFIALIALGLLGFLLAKYKNQLLPKTNQEEGGDIVTFSRETESAQKSIKTRISDLRGRIVQADLAIDGGEMQKAAEVYQAIQKEYDDLVINSVGAGEETQRALNEIYASIERIYERLSKNG